MRSLAERRWYRKRRANRYSVLHPTTKRPIGDPGTAVSNIPPRGVLRTAAALSGRSELLAKSVWPVAFSVLTWLSWAFAHLPTIRVAIEGSGLIVFAIIVYSVVAEREARIDETIARAWSTIGEAESSASQNIGIVNALETLAKYDKSLIDLNLPGAYLRGLTLQGAQLARSDFGVGFANPAIFQNHDFNLVNCDVPCGPPSCASNYCQWVSQLKNLDEPELERRSEGLEVDPTDLYGSNFSGSNLAHSDFRGATLVDSDFSLTCLLSARLAGADLDNANFEDAVLQDSNLESVLLNKDTSFRGADVTGATFRSAVCERNIGENWIYAVCTRKDFEEIVTEVVGRCGMTFPDGRVHKCDPDPAEVVRCKEKHGFYLTAEERENGESDIQAIDPHP